jgi:hypothetical protein
MILFFLLIFFSSFSSLFSFSDSLASSLSNILSHNLFMSHKEGKFKVFYNKYFSKIMSYDDISNVSKRFAFFFHYLEARNIGSLDLKENNQVDLIDGKNLSDKEKEALIFFYLSTLDVCKTFCSYIGKEGHENHEYVKDEFFRLFLNVRNDRFGFPLINKVNHNIADLTFTAKHIPFDLKDLRENIFSDVHSSPKYFGMSFLPIEKAFYQDGEIKNAESLEALYKRASIKMIIRERTFFTGDIGGRSALRDFVLHGDFKNLSHDLQYLLVDNCHEKIYAMVLDFFSLIHAAYQLYCLSHGNFDDILRFQVFGNHETEEVNLTFDKINYNLDYFSKMVSFLRILILPTEMNLFLKDKVVAVLRHGFFTRYESPEIHQSKQINRNFKITYLTDVLPTELQSSSLLAYSVKNGAISLNPQYWSDMTSEDDSHFEYNVLVEKKNDRVKDFVMSSQRGYSNVVSFERAAKENKKIAIENMIHSKDNFFSSADIEKIKNAKWAFFFGHNHSLKTLFNSLSCKDFVITRHPYYFENKEFLSHFSLCACENQFYKAFKMLSSHLINSMQSIKSISMNAENVSIPEEKPYLINWKEGFPLDMFKMLSYQIHLQREKNILENNVKKEKQATSHSGIPRALDRLRSKKSSFTSVGESGEIRSEDTINPEEKSEQSLFDQMPPKTKKIFKPIIIIREAQKQ